MSLPSAYLTEIESLSQEIRSSQPTDVLQFCANYFSRRLETERAGFLTSSRNRSYRSVSPGAPNRPNMASNTFPGRLGSNLNPFGGDGSGIGHEQASSGTITKVEEEDEDDAIKFKSPSSPQLGVSRDIPSFGASFGGDATGGAFPPSSFKPASGGFPEHYGMGRRTSVSAESLNPTASSNDNWSPPYHHKTQEQVARLKKSISGNFLFSHLDDEQSAQVLGALVEKPIPAVGIKVCANPFVLRFEPH